MLLLVVVFLLLLWLAIAKEEERRSSFIAKSVLGANERKDEGIAEKPSEMARIDQLERSRAVVGKTPIGVSSLRVADWIQPQAQLNSLNIFQKLVASPGIEY